LNKSPYFVINQELTLIYGTNLLSRHYENSPTFQSDSFEKRQAIPTQLNIVSNTFINMDSEIVSRSYWKSYWHRYLPWGL